MGSVAEDKIRDIAKDMLAKVNMCKSETVPEPLRSELLKQAYEMKRVADEDGQ